MASAAPAPPAASRWRIRLAVVLLAAVGLPLAAALLYVFPPGAGTFYPPCLFHAATGWHCPGCGATRCAHALVHGKLRQALAYHPLLVLALPLLAAGLARLAYSLWTGRHLHGRRVPGWVVRLVPWAIVAFWVLRNVDAYPFTLLAPHAL